MVSAIAAGQPMVIVRTIATRNYGRTTC